MNRKLFALLALVGLTVAPATTWALGSNHYAQLDLSVIGEKGGLVCATTSSAVPESGFGVTSSSGSIKSGSASLFSQDITIYAHAQANEGWEFLGWFESAEGTGSPKSKDNPYKCVIDASSTSSGSPTKKSLYAKFKNPLIKTPLSEVTFNLSATELNYTGGEQSVSISEVSYSGSGLTKDGDYTVDPSSVFAATGSARSNETYKVTITGMGDDYEGTVTKEWTIKAPSGEFAADALSTTAAGCELVDGAIKVTDSAALEYVAENKWKANAVIKFPVDLPAASGKQDDPKVKYIDEAHALIESTVGSVTKDIKNKQYKVINTVLGDHNYIDTITWTVDIPLEDVKAAAEGKKTALEYEISVGALAWTHYTTGLKPTTYKIVVPIDENLVLNDDGGNEMYPSNHKHLWDFAAAGATLTANCTNKNTECSIEGGKITLTLAAENQDYTGNAPTVSLDGKDDFDQYLKDRITYGTIAYEKPAYSKDKWYTGDYTAVVTVTVDGVAYELKKDFKITKPQGGYTDGFEANVGGSDVRFNTFAEASSVSTNNATVYYRGGDLNQKTIYFSSAKDITLDLGGKTLTYEKNEKMTIRNDGAGKVTFVNGTIKQPKGLIANHITLTCSNGGSMAFGDDIDLLNTATSSDNYLTVTVDGISVEIVNGKYQAFFAAENGGSLLVKGGDFAKNPEEFLAVGYALGKQKVTGYPFHVFEHTHDYSFTAAGAVITCRCAVPGCYYDGVSTELKAEDVMYDGEPHGATLVPVPGNGFPDVQITISYTTADGLAVNGVPSEIGEYVATATVDESVAPGVKATVRYRIEAGAIIVDGKHYALEDVPKFVEKTIAQGFLSDLHISVGKDFTAERAYKIPAPIASTDFAGMKTKYFDLNGFSITGAVDKAFFENKGKFVLYDSSEGQTGRMVANPENTEDVPLIINRAGKATKVLEADLIETYGGELTIESGIYLGAISNEVGEVIEVLGKQVDLSGKIVIKGGKFLYRPEKEWLDKGCYIVEETLDDGTPVFAVYPHQHNYKFVSLGSLAIGYCTTRDEGQGLLEPSSCQAKVVLMSAFMQNRAYNGQPVECKEAILSDQIVDVLYAILYGDLAKVDVSGSCYVNLSALFSQSFLDELVDSITERTLDEAAKSDIFDKFKDGLVSLRDLGKDELKVDEKTSLTQAEFEELTGATVEGPYWTTNASLIDEIFGDEDDELLDGAPRDAGAYKVCFDIQTPSTNTVSVKNPFEITPLPIEEVKIKTDPATTAFIYSGNQRGYTSIEVYSPIDKGNLTVDTDYVIGNVTNATNVGDYFFQVIGTRNYEGVTNIYWSIIKPVRPFPTDALEATEEGEEPYGVVNGPTLSVVNAPAIEYSVADQGWWIGYTINWPCVDGNKTLPEDAQLTITYPDWDKLDGTMVTCECTVADILNGDVALGWGGPFAEESCRLSAELDGDYVKSISWSVLFTPEDLYIAHDEGKLAELDFTIKAGTRSTDTNTEGLKETDFALVVPLGNLELYDVNGYRVFPVHLHTWKFEQDERGWLLSAQCVGDPKEEGECELDGDPWMTFGRYLNEEIEYTGKPVKVRKMNEWEFRFATGAIVGEVEYFETNDLNHALAEAPFQVGTYAARVVVTPMARKDGAGNEPFVLERTFKIVKPIFGYADGFEVKSTERRYDTYQEAVAALTGPGDTIYCHEDIEKAEIDLTTPYDVTIDLCDKIVTADAEMTIKNTKNTTVTLENGTVIQPRHYALKIIQQPDQAEATGKFVFGRAFRLRNVALLPSKHFTVTIPKDSSLEVTGGSYNAKFDDGVLVGKGGDISIKGGLFGMNFKPADKQIADGYEVREALGEFAYIVVEKGLSDEEFTQKLADSVVESVDNDVVRGKLAEILAKSAIKADEIFDWIKAKIGDLRQNLQEDIQQKIADIIGQLFNSNFLRAAFDLNTGLLDGQEVAIRDYNVAEDEITFRVTTGKGDSQEVVQTTAAKIAPYVQVSTSLMEPWASAEVQNIRVDESGLVHVTKPVDTAAYIQIVLPKD